MRQCVGDLLCLYSFVKDTAIKLGNFSLHCCYILIHIYSASCSADRRVMGQPCTGNGNRRLAYCFQIRFIPLLCFTMMLLLNQCFSFRQVDVIYVAISSPARLGSQLKDGTRHLANGTSIYVKTCLVPSVHLPASSGLALEAESTARLLSSNCCYRCYTVRGLGVMDLN